MDWLNKLYYTQTITYVNIICGKVFIWYLTIKNQIANIHEDIQCVCEMRERDKEEGEREA